MLLVATYSIVPRIYLVVVGIVQQLGTLASDGLDAIPSSGEIPARVGQVRYLHLLHCTFSLIANYKH